MTITPAHRAAMLRQLAQTIRTDVHNRHQIAQGFELIADCLEPCVDCGSKQSEFEETKPGCND